MRRRGVDPSASVLRAARSGDPEAQEAILRATRGMVLALARRYDRPAYPMADLAQDGRVGLLEGLRGYDPRRGPFLTFAYTRIRGAMLHALRDRGRLIRIACHVWESGAEGPIAAPMPRGVDGSEWEAPSPPKGLPPAEWVVLREALERLPPRRRRWVLAVVCDQESGAVIAHREGVSHNYVYREVRRGLADLRRCLEG